MAQFNVSVLNQLQSSLSESSTILRPGDGDYTERLKRWSSSAVKNAGIIVMPVTASDVSKAVLFSIEKKLELAVCGGGHATSGSSSTEGGLLIDLSKMRKVTVDPARKTIKAQGGALWEDVDREAAKYHLAAVGGLVNHTGIGGLTLGGGFGWLTPKFGLVIDNLLEVEFVLANGSIITASDTNYADLFWAAKGAGAAFGVATSFVYKAHDQPNNIWGGILAFPPTYIPEIVSFANGILEESQEDSMLFMGFGAPAPLLQPVVLTLVFYNGSEEEAKRAYAPLLKLGPVLDSTSSMPYSSANTMFNAEMSPGLRRIMKGSAFLAPLEIGHATKIFNDFAQFVAQNPDASRTIVGFEFVPFAKTIEVQQTATSFANRGAYGNLLFLGGWTSSEHDVTVREWTRKMALDARTELECRIAVGTDEVTECAVGEYANYDGLKVSGEVLFGVNFPRLVSLKKIYDPSNVFSHPDLTVIT